MPTVLVISLGGTIAMTPSAEGAGVRPTLDGDQLVAGAGEVARLATIRTYDWGRVPGAHLTIDQVIDVAERIRAEGPSVTGVVVTQGTDTIEETAFALDLLLDGDTPVVVTGAMRPASATSADGPANLEDAVRVATSPAACGLGVLVVLNEEIHSARLVRKTHSSSLATFASSPGPLGWVSEGDPQILLRPTVELSLPRPPTGPGVPVALVTGSLGDDGRLLAALPAAGYGGVVIEALGGGHLLPEAADEVERLVQQMPVVYASRTGRGRALERTYDFDGSELDLRRRGAIPSGWLDGPKARVLLSLLLRCGLAQHEVAAAFSGLAATPAASPA